MLKVRVTVNASATAFSDTNGARQTPLYDEVVSASVSTPAGGGSATPEPEALTHWPWNNTVTKGLKATTTHTVPLQIQTDGAFLVYTPDVTLIARAQVPDSRKYNNGSWETDLSGSVSAGGSYSAIIDNRSLRLTRPGAIGETYNPSTKTTHGHSIYSYHSWFQGGDVWNNQTYKPSFGGIWSQKQSNEISYTGTVPDVTWNWAPANPLMTGDTWSSATRTIPKGSVAQSAIPEWMGPASSPSQVGISYTATDNMDGATETANYILHLHDKYEVKSQDEQIEITTSSLINSIGA